MMEGMITETQSPDATTWDFTTSSSMLNDTLMSTVTTTSAAMMMFTSDVFATSEDLLTTGFGNGTGNLTNGTVIPHYRKVLQEFQKWLMTVALVVIMVAMGAVITVHDFKETFRHPVGFFIGLASQFVTMPLICFIAALVLRLEPSFALGLLIIGCCPGGTVSNVFTFWTYGDVCLSVSMTTVSCIAAIGMMPLNLFIYSRQWTTANARVPFLNIFTTLVSIVVPALAGMAIRRYSLKWAERVSKVGGVIAVLLVPLILILTGIINPSMFSSGWEVWVSTTILPFIGFTFGYGCSLIFKQPHRKCRTIGFETGIQNSALAVTVIIMSFNDQEILYDVMTVPALFGFISLADFLVCVFIYHVISYFRCHSVSTTRTSEAGHDSELRDIVHIRRGDRTKIDGAAGKSRGKLQPIKTSHHSDVIIRVPSLHNYQPITALEQYDLTVGVPVSTSPNSPGKSWQDEDLREF